MCFIDGAWPADTWMGQVAAELNLPMTAYLRPLLAHDDAEWHLRWFLPVGREQDICGHATLAAAHALFSEGRAAGTVRFSTRSGVLVAHACEDGSVTLEFPAAALEEGSAPAGLREALGVDIDAAYTTGELGDLLCVVRDEAAVRAADPDFAALTGVTRRQGMRGVILTAASSDPGGGVDYVSRCFYPRDGLPEDSVTGSAHTALAPYWSRRLGRDPLVGLQASARTGVVRTSIHGDRVHLTGRAVSLVDGTLHAREREAVATRDSVVAARNAG